MIGAQAVLRRRGMRRRSTVWPDGPRRRHARRSRWRRWAAAALAALAMLVTVGALRPAPAGGSGVPTLVMVRDVPAGQPLGAEDVTVTTRPGGQRPDSALSSAGAAVGRVAVGPLAANEVVTPARLVGDDLLTGQPADRVAVSVPVLDAAAVGVRPGNHVDLYATGTGARAAADATVVAVRDAEQAQAQGLGSGAPARVVLALDPGQATEVARALSALQAGQTLVVAVRRGAGTAPAQ